MRRMRRVGTVAVTVVVAGLLSGCMATSPQAAGTTGAATLGAAGAASTAAPPPAAHSTPRAVPIAPPTVFTGSDDAVVQITKPAGATAVIATITGNQAGKNFDVRALDGAPAQLVATTAPYSGSTLVDPLGTTTTHMRVHAIGPWTITLSDARSAPVFTTGYEGSGDTVLLHQGNGRLGTVSVSGSGPFRIKMYGNDRAYRPISGTGPWSGTFPWPDGVSLVAVQATGAWSIALTRF